MVDEPAVEQQAANDSMQIENAPVGWLDIDEMDRQDPQAVTHYVEEIYDNCREREVRPHDDEEDFESAKEERNRFFFACARSAFPVTLWRFWVPFHVTCITSRAISSSIWRIPTLDARIPTTNRFLSLPLSRSLLCGPPRCRTAPIHSDS